MRTCVIFMLGIILQSQLIFAADLAIVIGLKSDSAIANDTTVTVETKTGYNFGMLSLFEIGPQLLLRLGMIYSPRNYGTAAGEIKLTHMDLPVSMLWKFSDYGGVFAGANAALNVSAACPSGCANLVNVASGYQLGYHFKFAPHMGGVIYYEVMGALVRHIENPKAVAMQFLYTFE